METTDSTLDSAPPSQAPVTEGPPDPTDTTAESNPEDSTESGTTVVGVSPAGPRRTGQTATPATEAPSTESSVRQGLASGQALARRPDPALTGAQHLTLAGASGLQGRRNVIPLSSECAGTISATVEGFDLPVADVDQNPETFTLDAVGLDLGTKGISFDCGDEIVANFDLFVYRQNGAERGGANSIALISAVALAAMIGLFAMPSPLNGPTVTKRVEGPPAWPPPHVG